MKLSRKKLKKHYSFEEIDLPREDNMERFQIIMVICFFMSALQSLIYFQKMDLSLLGLIKLYSLFLGLSFLLPISLYRIKLTISFYEYIIFNVISIAPGLLAILFTLNASFSSPPYVESYKIVTMEHTEFKSVYTLEKNAYQEKEYLRSINDKDKVEISGNEFFSIHFSDGLFGLRIVEKKELH